MRNVKMKPETILLLRKLAREATIFSLLAMVLAGIGVFVYIDNEDRYWANATALATVHADDWNVYAQHSQPPTVEVPLTNGTVLHVRMCGKGDVFDQLAAGIHPEDCKELSYPFEQLGGRLTSIPLGHPQQIAIEKDYWTAYKSMRHHMLGTEVSISLFYGLCGLLAGLVLWIFYRLVRFAVKR